MRINSATDNIRIGIDLPKHSIEVPYLQNPQVKGWFEQSLDADTWELRKQDQDTLRFELRNMTADMIELTLDAMRVELWDTPNDSRGYIVYQLRKELKQARNSKKGQTYLCT